MRFEVLVLWVFVSSLVVFIYVSGEIVPSQSINIY